MRRPDMLDGHGELCLLVVKTTNATNTKLKESTTHENHEGGLSRDIEKVAPAHAVSTLAKQRTRQTIRAKIPCYLGP